MKHRGSIKKLNGETLTVRFDHCRCPVVENRTGKQVFRPAQWLDVSVYRFVCHSKEEATVDGL